MAHAAKRIAGLSQDAEMMARASMQTLQKNSRAILCALATLLCASCLTEATVLQQPDPGTAPNGQDDLGGSLSTTPTIVSDGRPTACLHTVQKVDLATHDKLDLLFVVDDSSSMAGAQAALNVQLPRLLNTLMTGHRDALDEHPFPAIRDLHVGVVSSDMGTPGVNFGNCRADGGDDGRLQHTPHGERCDPSYPRFLSYGTVGKNGPASDFAKFIDDVACVATLGTSGCDFQQPLEAPLKALSPATPTEASGIVLPDPQTFVSFNPEGRHGWGDVSEDLGGNLGFLRNDPAEGLSMIAIVVLTDHDDCSVRSAEHLSPASDEDINLRCFNHKEFLYDVKQRYYDGLRALRPGHEDLVMFAGIVGVPADTVDAVARNFDFSDAISRDAFYDSILNDARMQEEIDPQSEAGSGSGKLKPSCERQVEGASQPSAAYPPRRIVELAKLFGENGIVQSICQDDFAPAMDAITDLLAPKSGETCLPNQLTRQHDGRVPCELTWELPKAAIPGSSTPTTCDSLPFLKPVADGRAATHAAGGNNCKVTQLAVDDGDIVDRAPPSGDGWFYDDHTDELRAGCPMDRPHRIAFSPTAKPPAGVTVRLECQTAISAVPSKQNGTTALKQPEIGSPCGPMPEQSAITGDAACVVQRADATLDESMFCHPNMLACVRSCESDLDCPSGWLCDSRPETLNETRGLSYCVNPTCTAWN